MKLSILSLLACVAHANVITSPGLINSGSSFSSTFNTQLVLDPNGYLRYEVNGITLWAGVNQVRTGVVGPYKFRVQSDGNLTVKDVNNLTLWASNTAVGSTLGPFTLNFFNSYWMILRDKNNAQVWKANILHPQTAITYGAKIKAHVNAKPLSCCEDNYPLTSSYVDAAGNWKPVYETAFAYCDTRWHDWEGECPDTVPASDLINEAVIMA